MSTTIHFTKMHGAGNDYIYVDVRNQALTEPEKIAQVWSQPHTGIGSDGLVLIGTASSPEADFSMRIFNADGSEAMMCGNASRCIGKYLYDKGICRKDEIRLETLSGIKVLHLHLIDNVVDSVTVDMLSPELTDEHLFTGTAPSLPYLIKGSEACFVSMGNPHYVIFVDDVEHVDIETCGSLLEVDRAFPQRCNIEFAQITAPGIIRTRVWERGSGITQACGTGACATAVAAHVLGLASRRSQIVMDGGTLDIEWKENDGHVYLTGPAEFVFEGDATWNS